MQDKKELINKEVIKKLSEIIQTLIEDYQGCLDFLERLTTEITLKSRDYEFKNHTNQMIQSRRSEMGKVVEIMKRIEDLLLEKNVNN